MQFAHIKCSTVEMDVVLMLNYSVIKMTIAETFQMKKTVLKTGLKKWLA